MDSSLSLWMRRSLFSLLIVATLGVLMRYKIVFPLPWIDQRNLLHAHSHFAFSGWVSQALMALMVNYLDGKGQKLAWSRYRTLLRAQLLTAYGMLLTFPFLGYSFFPILFSTLSIFVAYWFAVVYWKDLGRLTTRTVSVWWLKAAVLFNAISSLGAFYLAYMLATKHVHPNSYLASVYFFLHFQYNGWFFFACMGLLCDQLIRVGIETRILKRIFRAFVLAALPAYFLSALWLPMARWVYLLIVAAVILQLWGWWQMLLCLRKANHQWRSTIPGFSRVVLLLSGTALTIKLLLQAGSVIPSLSRLAFGFRPIVIGYLHLVLLGVISLFLLGYSQAFAFLLRERMHRVGITVFAAGIVANELLLMIQGIADMSYVPASWVNTALLAVSLILFAGAFLINFGTGMRQRIK